MEVKFLGERRELRLIDLYANYLLLCSELEEVRATIGNIVEL